MNTVGNLTWNPSFLIPLLRLLLSCGGDLIAKDEATTPNLFL